MELRSLSTRALFLVFMLVSAHAVGYGVDCPTCQTSFGAPSQLPVSGIDEVASADFNGDSNPDLVALKSSTNEVLFLAGNGAGNFAAPISSPVTLSSRRSLVVADLNNDGKLDLIITNFTTSVSILFGNGAGTFTLHATLTVAASADRVAVANLNDDDNQDLAVLSRGACTADTVFQCKTNTVTIFSGNAVGDFALIGSFPVGAARSSDMKTADFNGDGNIDLALLGRPVNGDSSVLMAPKGQFVQVRFGDGKGNLGPANFLGTTAPDSTDFSGPDLFTNFGIGDFNNDDKPDIAASTFDKIRIHLSDGQGGFTAIDNPNYTSLSDLTSLSVADFNSDGKQDVFVNTPFIFNDGSSLTGYAPLGDGHGNLQLPAPIGQGVIGNFVTTGDFNKDGKPDLAVSNGNLTVLLNVTDCSQPIACVLDGDMAVTEGNVGARNVDVTVKLSAPSNTAITVDFATVEFEESFHVSAQSGIDFKPVNGTLTFTPSATTRTVTLTIFGDTTYELDEPFRLALTGATGAKIVRLPVSLKPPLVRILNDDAKPSSDPVPHVQISDATVFEGNSGTKQAIFTVTLSAPQSDYRNLIHRTVDGSAGSSDYQGIPAISPRDLWFAPGDTTRTISITIFGDTVSEGDESFFVELIPSQSVIFDRSRGVGTILDDDAFVSPVAPILLTEEGSPRAIALDAVVHTIEPFSLINNNYLFSSNSDKRTRVSFFARNLNFSPNEDPLTALSVFLLDVDPTANPGIHKSTLEFVGLLPGTDVTQIIVRLPEDITPIGDKLVFLSRDTNASNRAVITLKPTP